MGRWLNEECGFKLNEMETTLILSRYDKNGNYKISKDEFELEVTGVAQEEEELFEEGEPMVEDRFEEEDSLIQK